MRELGTRLGALAEAFRRRRIAVGLDERGQVVLARPDTIRVDYRGSTKRRKQVLELVKHVDADNERAVERSGAEESGVLTIGVPTQPAEIAGEDRWPVAPLRQPLDHFTNNGVRADPNQIVFGAHSAVPALLTTVVAGSSAPSGLATTLSTPENRALLVTSAEPAVPPRVLRAPLDVPGYRPPKVLVLDTGLKVERVGDGAAPSFRPEHSELNVLGRDGPRVHVHAAWQSSTQVDALDDDDEADDDGLGSLDVQAGHGTFIAGIIRQICPDAEIHPAGVLSSFGEGSVSRIESTLLRMRPCGPFDLVVMSLGTLCPGDDPGLFGTSLPDLLGGALAVAAAGNLQTSRPYFPAALPGVVGVGGLDRQGRAWFSNFGGWVDACAPCAGVVSTFFDGVVDRRTGSSPRHFERWARWSGTSFAAPKVAGAIALEMYLSQVDAHEAWARLSTSDRLRSPDLGVVFNL